jgi:hypothetical protein
MESEVNRPDSNPAPWTELAPLLDAAMGQLGQKDHCAIVLRFFDGKDLKAVGNALGVSENAAKVRVHRATEKLRKLLVQRGIKLSTAAIGTAVSAHSVQAAPIGLAASVTTAAVKGTMAAASTSTLTTSTLKLMAWTKLKTAAVAGAIAIIAAGTATVVLQRDGASIKHASFAFAGFATPEASVESVLWAAKAGDLEKFPAGIVPQEMERFNNRMAGKSADQIKRETMAWAAALTGYQITQKEVISEDEVHVHLLARPSANSLQDGRAILIMKRVGNEWKFAGNAS